MSIAAIAFDLDGTLVQTEKLKALSYAKATVELCPYTVSEEEATQAFKEFVGLSRKEVAEGLIQRFELEEKAVKRLQDMGVETTWQAFVQIRLRYYEDLLADPSILRNNQWAHSVDILLRAHQNTVPTGLATMSHRPQVNKVLSILDIRDRFNFIATRDDVEQGKPDPEIYRLVADEMGIAPEQFLVLEDSPSGVQAAIAAGMTVIAIPTPFTREHLHAMDILKPEQLVDDPTNLLDTIHKFTNLI